MTTDIRDRAKQWARTMTRDVYATWFAARDSRTPWLAKALAIAVAAYAISPIDLIPDFIPVLGLLDDLIIVPLGIALVVKLIPPQLIAEQRQAAAKMVGRPVSRLGAVLIILVWAACIWLIARHFH